MMKKVMKNLVVLVIICMVFGLSSSYANTGTTIADIVKKYNEKAIEEGIEDSTAQEVSGGIEIKTIIEGQEYITNFSIVNNIFSYTMDLNLDPDATNLGSANVLLEISLVNIIMESIAELNGYSFEEVSTNIESPDISKYTIEKDGLEVTQNQDGTVTVKMNITKKVVFESNTGNTGSTGNTGNTESNETNIEVLPETGLKDNTIITIVCGATLVLGIAILIYAVKRKNK